MIAKFNSVCPFCDSRIHASIDGVTKRDGKWGHAKCPAPRSTFESTSAHIHGLRQAIADAPVSTVSVVSIADESIAAHETFVPSHFQQAIYDWIQTGTGNAVVEAVAGSGKTTTLLEALAFTPTDAAVAFCAFNKHIADELKKRAPAHVRVGTLHSLGYAALRRAFGRVEVDDTKIERIMDEHIPVDHTAPTMDRMEARIKRGMLRKLVALVKATTLDYHIASIGLEALADRYGIDLNGQGESIFAFVEPVLTRCAEQTAVIDYDDMLWLPVILNLQLTRYDWLFVDEAQDLNKVQIEFLLRSIQPAGRTIAVGDRKQSLYGFRGADTEAIPNLITALNATVLPLSICYRCPSSHVALAKELVPQIEPRPDAPEGVIATIRANRLNQLAQAGDMILCRVNAPLVSVAFSLIRQGVKATVRGRDIGKGIIDFVKKFDAESIEQLFQRMDEYRTRETSRLLARPGKEMQIEALHDKCSTVAAVADECAHVRGIISKLESLFSDTVEGVVLSSVHRAKGLQARRVFILKPKLMPHPRAKGDWQMEQEWNCKYVALTRSMSELYFVEDRED